MSPVLNSILGISIIFLCTTLGSSFVFFLKRDSITPKLNRIFMGFAAGIMLSASVFSLIMPALETEVTYMPNYALVAIAVLAGAGFLWGIDNRRQALSFDFFHLIWNNIHNHIILFYLILV